MATYHDKVVVLMSKGVRQSCCQPKLYLQCSKSQVLVSLRRTITQSVVDSQSQAGDALKIKSLRRHLIFHHHHHWLLLHQLTLAEASPAASSPPEAFFTCGPCEVLEEAKLRGSAMVARVMTPKVPSDPTKRLFRSKPVLSLFSMRGCYMYIK